MIEQLKEWLRQIDAGSMSERDLYPLVKSLVKQHYPDCANAIRALPASPAEPEQPAQDTKGGV